MKKKDNTKNSNNTDEKLVKLKDGAHIVLERVQRHSGAITLFSILGLISTLGSSAIPYITGKIFDVILSGGNISLMLGISASLFGLLAAFAIIRLIVSLVDWQLVLRMDWLAHEIEGEYLVDSVRKLFHLPLSFHHDKKVGKTMSKIHRARNGLRSVLVQIPQIAPPVASLLVAFAFTFFISSTLSFVLLAGVVLYSLFFVMNVRPLAKLMEKTHKAWTDMFGDAWDAVLNPRVVKLMQMEDNEADKVKKDFMEKALPAWFAVFTQWQKLSLGQRLVVLVTQVLLLVIGAPMVQSGVLSIGDLIAFNAYASLIFGPFVRLGQQWQQIQDGLVDITKTEEMLDVPPEDYGLKRDSIIQLDGDMIFDNVSFSYIDKEGDVLSSLSFMANFGDTIAIVGKSGEGKSTLVDLIPRFIKPTDGSITIDGINIEDISLQNLRSRIALVPQRVDLFNKTIRENIMYGRPDATDNEIKEAARKAQALEFIEKSHDGFNSKVGEKGLKLSAGQSQRIAIARAFLADPDILILDEPTSALDAENEKLIVDVLKDLMKGRTTFIIAHRLSTVQTADTILVIDNGNIAESGTHNELIDKDGIYKNLYEMQIGLH
jgi:ABC-type multidrug transport system fused ATPase/permease subunit